MDKGPNLYAAFRRGDTGSDTDGQEVHSPQIRRVVEARKEALALKREMARFQREVARFEWQEAERAEKNHADKMRRRREARMQDEIEQLQHKHMIESMELEHRLKMERLTRESQTEGQHHTGGTGERNTLANTAIHNCVIAFGSHAQASSTHTHDGIYISRNDLSDIVKSAIKEALVPVLADLAELKNVVAELKNGCLRA